MSDTFRVSLDPTLRSLLFMQSKGKLRRTWKKLSSPRQAIPTAIVVVLMLLYVVQVYIALAFNTSSTRIPIESIAPLGMLSILCLKLLGVCIDRKKSGAGFRHEEIHRLLGGPFSLPQVRLYRTAGHAVSIFFTSIFAAIFFRFHVPSFIAALSGAYLAMLFTYLVYTMIAVAALNANEESYKRIRNVACGLGLGLLGFILYRVSLLQVSNLAFLKAFGDEAIAISQTPVGRVLMCPFAIFTNIVVAENPRQWAIWTMSGLALNYLTLHALLRTEVRFDIWARRREREQFLLKQDSMVGAKAQKGALRVSEFKRSILWCDGAGPIAMIGGTR